jgi:predicted DNA-binding transcriptional regulator YafY
MTHPASRLITLIMLLQRRPNQKAAVLADELGISVRTLHRYFEMLDEMGIPVYTDRGPHGGFSLVRGYKMPPLVLTPDEATAVSLGTSLVEEMWGPLYRDAARAALAKLDNLLPDEQRGEVAWARRSLVATGFHRSDLDELVPTLSVLRRALRERHRVRIVYQGSAQTTPEGRDVDPYALVHRWGWGYLIAYCHLRSALRSFRVDRILEIDERAESYTIPADFDVRRYLERDLPEQAGLRVRLRFEPQGAQIALANRSMWENLEEQPDGSIIVWMQSPDLIWAASFVLSFGPWVSVLEPAELRAQVGEWAAAILRNASNLEEK